MSTVKNTEASVECCVELTQKIVDLITAGNYSTTEALGAIFVTYSELLLACPDRTFAIGVWLESVKFLEFDLYKDIR